MKFDKRDGPHEIINDVELVANGVLHRFNNRSGVPYSAIYIDNVECYSNVREEEQKMIDCWNDHGGEEWKLFLSSKISDLFDSAPEDMREN